MQIEVEVKGQRIKRINSPGSVEDTLNYLTCHFVFEGEEWDDTVRTAYFENPASRKRHPKILADDGTCTVPWEALTDKGFVRFSVAGERENYRITTGIESFYNSETVYGGNPSEPPTPNQYDQLIALAEQTKEIAESVREDADAGEFDGPPGLQGPKGEDGDPGPQGPAGKDGQDATDEQVRTAVDAYMEEHPIQADSDDIIKLAIKNEASGAVPISITDSADMGVQDLEMQGWTEQDSYDGKNLLPVDVEQEFTGVAATDSATFEEDGVHAIYESIVSGEARDIYLYGDSNVSVESGYVEVLNLTPGDYRLVNDNVGISLYVVAWRNGASVVLGYADNVSKKITIQDGDKFRIFLRCNIPGDTDVKIHPMIVKEGDDTTVYEPYTGGQPSPNPDYPQEITSAGKYDEASRKYEYEVKLTGANLFDISKVITNSGLLTNNGDGTLTATPGSGDSAVSGKAPRTLRDYCPELISGKTYRLSANTTGITKQIYLLGVNKIWAYGRPRTITDADLESEVFFYASGVNTEAVISDIMITEVEDADYEPYRTTQTVTLTSDRPLTKWDKLEKRNGQWGWVYKSNVLTYDGDENWIYDVNNTRGEYSALYYWDTGLLNKNYSYCSKFGHIAQPYDGEGIMDNNGDSRSFYVSIRTDRLDTPDANGFKQWLQLNPLTVWYETAEETFAPLSESEQEQMNELYTYYPTTVLSNDVGCEMTIKYIADTKAYIDSKIAAIQAAIVNTI